MKHKLVDIPEYWHTTLLSVGVLCLLSFAIFFESWSSIVTIWYRSSTFTHGFLIIPISLWLIWTRKEYYLQLQPKISWLALVAVILSGFAWLLAKLISVQVIEQFATVGLFLSGLWLLLGSHVIKQLLFPLGFLFFMVPIGEELIPPLMEFTATFTVGLIRLTGMSVFREGLHFSLVSGNWSVVEACSGISYLIASVTLGLVYAYLTYTSLWKRAIFIVLSMLVPILANGVRAYLIVMIGHFSSMTLAVGVDHLIYGGVFFGLVMMILFYIGSFWRDSEDSSAPIAAENTHTFNVSHYSLSIAGFVLIISYSVWPLTSSWLSNQPKNTPIPAFVKSSFDDWQETTEPNWQWEASLPGVVDETKAFFKKEGRILGLYRVSFGEETQQTGELINSQNLFIAKKDLRWKIIKRSVVALKNKQHTNFKAEQAILSRDFKDLIILRWYRIGTHDTSNKYLAKLYQLFKRLTADASPEYLIMVAIDSPPHKHEISNTLLLDFINSGLNN